MKSIVIRWALDDQSNDEAIAMQTLDTLLTQGYAVIGSGQYSLPKKDASGPRCYVAYLVMGAPIKSMRARKMPR